MTRDDIIRMAREAGVTDGIELPAEVAAVERFAALVAAREREACAHVCLELAINWLGDPDLAGMSDGAEDCAAAIRERGNP